MLNILIEMYMGIGHPKHLTYMGFLKMEKVARTLICVKDTMRYKTGERKNHKLFLSFLNFSVYCP